MKKTIAVALVVALSISLYGCAEGAKTEPTKLPGVSADQALQDNEKDRAAVEKLVKDFGTKLQTVSLQAPKDILIKSMQENYGNYVKPALIEKWSNDPVNAPGRVSSSPWPDRIEISTVDKISDNAFEVTGKVIEITSQELANGGIAAKRPITLKVEKADSQWIISDVSLGAYENVNSNIYKNTEYGFNFTLPDSWKDYKIVADKWEGLAVGGSEGQKVVESGPMLSIRHPQWTAEKPRQDIPIMIFTLSQWEQLQKDKFHIGAAPVNPTELGRNAKYVFALPARYNYAFPAGYEEVEQILKGNPLQTNGGGC